MYIFFCNGLKSVALVVTAKFGQGIPYIHLDPPNKNPTLHKKTHLTTSRYCRFVSWMSRVLDTPQTQDTKQNPYQY